MGDGTYKLARQIVGRGYYAEVAVSVVRQAVDRGRHIEFAPECDVTWHAAARFGLEGALACMAADRTPTGLMVLVTRIHWEPVDTRFMCVAYAAAEALWAALGFRPGCHPEIDWEHGQLVFPL